MVTALKRRLFNLLMEQLVQAEVEEFRLDKGASFNPAEAEGKANLAKRFVLSSLYLTAAYVRTAVLLEMTSASQSLHPVRILTLGQIATLLNNILVRVWVRCHVQKMNRFAGEKVKDPFAGMLATTLTARPALRNLLRLFVDLVGEWRWIDAQHASETDAEVLKALGMLTNDASILSLLTQLLQGTVRVRACAEH